MTLFRDKAVAKLNLFLEVLGKRSDGFHEILSLVVPIDLFDDLEFEFLPQTQKEDQLECLTDNGISAPSIPTDERNLIRQAINIFRKFQNRRSIELPPLHVRLLKRIPHAAGLGGGSSDAATTLRVLNRLTSDPLSTSELRQIATVLGSDVPLFLESGAVFCRGRGEQIEAVGPLQKMTFLLLKPPLGLSTPEVYSLCDQLPMYLPKMEDPLLVSLLAGDLQTAGSFFFNRLEEPAAKLCPELVHWKTELQAFGLTPVMTGSGSTLFALCPSQETGMRILEQLRSKISDNFFISVCSSLKHTFEEP